MNYKGDIKDFPKEVVEKMLERQVEQGNKRDVSVFEINKSRSKFTRAFNWSDSVEGFTFWNDVINKQNFNLFFEKYPKDELPEKWCIKTTKDSEVHKWFEQKLGRSIMNAEISFYHHPEVRRNVCTSSYIHKGYTEITFDQFKKHILKQTTYTIKDLSEGKVACVNDGTLGELETVMKKAFPNITYEILGKSKVYYKSFNSNMSWACSDEVNLPTQSVKEFYKQLNQTKMDNRFPFKLEMKDAQSIIDIACSDWRSKLADKWAKDLIMDCYTMISEDFYEEMRKVCTPSQHKLFDKIFGKDEDKNGVFTKEGFKALEDLLNDQRYLKFEKWEKIPGKYKEEKAKEISKLIYDKWCK